MPYLQPFDPWKSPLCTCPPKYTLNPYTGCGHRCIYCYATSFIKNFYSPRPKKDFLKRIKKELTKLPQGALVSLSNSSDPYQPLEKNFQLTKKFLRLIQELNLNLRVLIITKSSLVERDISLLKNLRCAVSITITTFKYWKILEPGSSPPEERVEALKKLKTAGIPTILRLDPIIPEINETEVEEIIKKTADFVDHLITSTYKAKRDSLNRLVKAFPEKAKYLSFLYSKKGEKLSGSYYLPKELRKRIISRVYEIAKMYGLSFATCREGLKEFAFKERCDGSFLIDRFF